MEPRVDLHLHTHHSDGTFPPEELIRRAKSLGLTTLSVTDHDTIAALPAARAAAGKDLEILSGVELTAASHDRELHILGYGFREEDPALRGYMEQARDRRHGRIQAMIDQLKTRGIEVTLQEVEWIAGEGNSIGRPHLAEAMMKKGAVRSLSEAFDLYLGDHAPCFVKQAILTVADAVRLIRQAGGIAVLAHPHRIVEDAWIPDLVADGVEGIEVYHSDHNPSVTGHYRQIAQQRGLLMTGGSNCHGFRKSNGPLIGTVKVPAACLDQLKAALSRA